MFKQIYSFTIQSEKEVEKITKKVMKNDEGVEEEVEVKKKVKEKYPIEFLIKKPSRRELEEADTEFSIAMSQSVKKGILTKAMLAKKYADSGGALTEDDANELLENYKKLNEFEQDLTKMGIQGYDENDQENQEKLKKLNSDMVEIRKKIIDLESNYQTLFTHTADIKAQQTIVLWYVLFLTYFKADEKDSKPKIYFQGDTFQQKLDNYYGKDEANDEIFHKVADKIATIISYWYFSGNDFDKDHLSSVIEDQ